MKRFFNPKAAAKIQEAPKPGTLEALVMEYKRIYALKDVDAGNNIGHDGVHALTGFGIGIADELRIAAVESHLYEYDNDADLRRTFKWQESLHGGLIKWMRDESPLNAHENALDVTAFRRVQLQTKPLDPREVEALYFLGRQLNETIRKATGRYYVELDKNQMAALDFTKVDFVARAHAIKTAYQTTDNHALSCLTANILFNAAAAKNRGHDIPAAGTPWHGPLKRSITV